MKANFKGCNYDLDTQVSKFMNAREERNAKAETRKIEEVDQTVLIPEDEEFASMSKEEKR